MISPIFSESLAQRNQIIDTHRQLILEIRKLEPEISKFAAGRDPRWRELEQKRSALVKEIEPLIKEYWSWVPAVQLSRCPFCQEDLMRLFDPVDLTGFWWMDRTWRPRPEPECCPHFCLLLGAVNFNGLPPRGGIFECRPGPDMPFVIPRILEMPTMTAVVSRIPLQCGYSAYPLAYFSRVPPKTRSLTQSWARKEYRFMLEDGRRGWDIVDNFYDYDLTPWLRQGKLGWFHEGTLNAQGAPPEAYPFKDLKGTAREQVLIDHELRFAFKRML